MNRYFITMSAVKISVLLIALVTLAMPSQAGVIGWFSRRSVDWEFIQSTGGMKISAPVKREGNWYPPIESAVHGLRGVTHKPTLMNSAPHVCMWTLTRDGSRLLLRAKVALSKKGDAGIVRYEARMKAVRPGLYQVFYDDEKGADPLIGTVEIAPEKIAPGSH
mgnify:CR=1 FL=1